MPLKRLVLATVIVACAAAAQPSGTGILAGQVILKTGGEPVRKAAVHLIWHGSPAAVALARTDGGGRFAFEGLPAGRYSLNATRDGLGTGVLGDAGEGAAGEFVTLGEGERRGGLIIRISLPASISGIVFDAEGEE